MGKIKFCDTKSHFTHVNKLVRACTTFLISVYTFMLKILGFIARYARRSNTEVNDSFFCADRSKKGDEIVSEKSTDFLLSGLVEKGSSESEKFNRINSETEDSVSVETDLVSYNNKYQRQPRKDVNGFIEGPGSVIFSVEEMFLGSDDDFSSGDQSLDYKISPRAEFVEQKMEENRQQFDKEIETIKFPVEEMFLESNDDLSSSDQSSDHEISPTTESLEQKMEGNIQELDKELEIIDKEKIKSTSNSLSDEQKSASFHDKIPQFEAMESVEDQHMEDQDFSYEIELFPGGKLAASEVNQSSTFTEFKFFLSPQKIESTHDAFLEEDVHRRPKDMNGNHLEEQRINQTRFDSDDEYIELEPARVNPANIDQESSCREEFMERKELNESEKFDCSRDEHNSWDSDFKDESEHDVLWEHQHLVQQMKMELRSCRIGVLPTISEDGETPKVAEDLKPLKIDQKFEYKDLVDDIHKFYRSYAEKMKKLDVLNFQTLQAMSFLQLKDSEIFTSGKKRYVSKLKPFTLPKIWPGEVQRIHADPTVRSIVELNRDLELVYVGQVCLSWEILSWMYTKAKELIQYDSQGSHSYNRVLEEFQQFQVLMHRFLENEPFQGPRVQNYVKNRSMIRGLLQVPLIIDDYEKDKKARIEEKDSISLEMLVQIVKESMLLFREFLRSDKSRKDRGTKIDDIQEPEIVVLLVSVMTTLQKKEKKLKENIRMKSCIVKKIQKQEESDQSWTSEVELRLVSRVIGLSRLSRDQLLWCQTKLHNISFMNRKVHLEPSFLLFPC